VCRPPGARGPKGCLRRDEKSPPLYLLLGRGQGGFWYVIWCPKHHLRCDQIDRVRLVTELKTFVVAEMRSLQQADAPRLQKQGLTCHKAPTRGRGLVAPARTSGSPRAHQLDSDLPHARHEARDEDCRGPRVCPRPPQKEGCSSLPVDTELFV
jgi:hypothetical protein